MYEEKAQSRIKPPQKLGVEGHSQLIELHPERMPEPHRIRRNPLGGVDWFLVAAFIVIIGLLVLSVTIIF